MLNAVSPAVKLIGACNTITKMQDGRLVGDNTDWLGICAALTPHLPAQRPATDVAVVVGGGGTARAALFAMQQLGYSGARLLIHNPRTKSKAAGLAKEFKCLVANEFTVQAVCTATQNAKTNVRVVVSTLPGKVGFTLSSCVLAHKPLVMDVSYLPKQTPLGQQVDDAKLTMVRGIDMLVAQGLGQFELWTGKTSAGPIINKAGRAFYAQL